MTFLEKKIYKEKQGNFCCCGESFYVVGQNCKLRKKDFSESRVCAVTVFTLGHINAYFQLMLF